MYKSKSSRREEKNENIVVNLAIGGVIGFAVFLISAFAFAYAELKMSMGQSAYLPGLLALGTLSAFLNGFVAVKPVKRAGAPFGAASGAIEAVMVFLAALIINRADLGKWLFILALLIIAASAAGGITAANMRPRRKY